MAEIRVAETPEENRRALEQFAMWQMTRDPLTLDDRELLPLLEEPETYTRLSMLERELVIRLGAAWEMINRMDAEAMEQGICLN